jgi:hypothetical protein
MAGAINIADSAAGSTMSFTGDVTGNVAARLFGNVVIWGRLTGVLGTPTTLAGVANMLWVLGPGGGGLLVPNNAIFATRIGYP